MDDAFSGEPRREDDIGVDVVDKAFLSEIYRKLSIWIDQRESEFISLVTSICEVPAPPFKEEKRAQFVAEQFRKAGLRAVSTDEEGNVVALYPEGKPSEEILVVSAHIDTVFPEGTDTRVRRDDGKLYAPGIGDNAAGVAAMLFLAQGLLLAGFTPSRTIAFLANVGEEGLGNLRGMRYFFNRGLAAQKRVGAVLVLDGRLGVIGSQAVGSRRFSVTYKGPGGHSWTDFGRASAIHALGRAIAAISEIQVPSDPKTTFNVGTVSGGTSVNAIAETATMLVDMRSVDAGALAELERAVRQAIQGAAARENGIEVEVQVVSDRPTGRMDPRHPLIQIVEGAAARLGVEIQHEAMSTDANIPLSMGIPAVVIGTKAGGGAHTHKEFVYVDSLRLGVKFALLSLLSTEIWLAKGES